MKWPTYRQTPSAKWCKAMVGNWSPHQSTKSLQLGLKSPNVRTLARVNAVRVVACFLNYYYYLFKWTRLLLFSWLFFFYLFWLCFFVFGFFLLPFLFLLLFENLSNDTFKDRSVQECGHCLTFLHSDFHFNLTDFHFDFRLAFSNHFLQRIFL